MSKISPATVLLGVFAVLFGIVGAYIVKDQLGRQEPVAQEPEPPAEPEPLIVPMTSMDLQSGKTIALGDIALHRMTPAELKERGIKGGYMLNTEQVIGRVVRGDLAKGQPFYTDDFYSEGTGPDIAENLQPGERAVTIPVYLDSAVAGFAGPGQRVDVLFRAHAQNEDFPETTVTLLENVRVLALEQDTFTGARSLRDSGRVRRDTTQVTIAVKPGDAVSLRVVEDRGELSLALRNPDDPTNLDGDPPRTLNDLLGIVPPPVVEPPPVKAIDVYRGRQKSTVIFEGAQNVPVDNDQDQPLAPAGV